MSKHDFIIKFISNELPESGQLTETLYNALIKALMNAFSLKHVEARKEAIAALRALYA